MWQEKWTSVNAFIIFLPRCEILESRSRWPNSDRIKKELSDAEATRLSIIQKATDQANQIIPEAEKSSARP
jgi:hypothetical protein